MIVEVIVGTILILLTVCFISKFMPDTDIDLNTLGRWAVITGSTDGIGKALAHEVAKRGFNVYLVSKSIKKLESNANEIREKYGVSAKVFQTDFSEVDKKVNAALKEELQSLEIGILINNVGTACPHPEYFFELEKNHEELYEQLINVNIMSTVNMTRFVLPVMLKAGNGLIINVSSLFSEFPAPLQAMYGASKSFVAKFSKDLDLETRHKGVHVHVLTTGLVATKLSGASVSDWFPPAVSPEEYAKSALDMATRRRVSCGHMSHSLQAMLMRLVPHLIIEKFFFATMIRRKQATIKDCARCGPDPQ